MRVKQNDWDVEELNNNFKLDLAKATSISLPQSLKLKFVAPPFNATFYYEYVVVVDSSALPFQLLDYIKTPFMPSQLPKAS